MADTPRNIAALKSLLADNTTGDISPQDIRDFLVSCLNTQDTATQSLSSKLEVNDRLTASQLVVTGGSFTVDAGGNVVIGGTITATGAGFAAVAFSGQYSDLLGTPTGGGGTGTVGPTGATGPTGDPGPSGANGLDGTRFLAGYAYNNDPSSYGFYGTNTGDLFVDTSAPGYSGYVWQWNGSWSNIGSLQGSSGPQGPTGPDIAGLSSDGYNGITITGGITAYGLPTSDPSITGTFYIDTMTGYIKVSGY